LRWHYSRVHVERRRLSLDIDFFLLYVDFERDVELRGLAGGNLHVVLHKNGKPLGIRRDRVLAWRKISNFVVAGFAGGGRMRWPAGHQNRNRGIRNHRARRVSHLPAQGSCGCGWGGGLRRGRCHQPPSAATIRIAIIKFVRINTNLFNTQPFSFQADRME